jgi:hypothetical protein
VLSLVTGPLIVFALNWRIINQFGQATTAERTPTLSATPTPVATSPALLHEIADLTSPAAEVAAPATPSAMASPPVGVAALEPAAAPTVVTPASAQEEAWRQLVPRLDALWGADTAQTVALLEDFRSRFPDFAPAREKMYAALLAQAQDLARRGETTAAAAQLSRAAALLPDRPEAPVALRALTPTPTPPPTPEVQQVQPPPNQPPRPPAIVLARATPVPRPITPPVQRQVAPAPAATVPTATPTKVPFRPPPGP